MVGAPRFDLACFSLFSLSLGLGFACFLVDRFGCYTYRQGELPKGECCRALSALSFLARSGRPMDCGMLLAPAVRLLARNTLDVAPLLLPLLVFTLVASPFVALVLKAGLKKSWIYALEWILLKLSQGHPGGPQIVKRGLKRAATGVVGRNAFASGAFWLTTIACMAPAMAVRCSSCKDNHSTRRKRNRIRLLSTVLYEVLVVNYFGVQHECEGRGGAHSYQDSWSLRFPWCHP